MAVYYKFKSERDYYSIPVDVPFISVGTLKRKIFLTKIGKGKDYDILVTNAQTNEGGFLRWLRFYILFENGWSRR